VEKAYINLGIFCVIGALAPILPAFATNDLGGQVAQASTLMAQSDTIYHTKVYSFSENLVAQKAPITSVSQLSDVQPSDWAFQALRTLVERYSCLAGYSDNLFRGDRVLNRYEFAASLDTCLKRVNKQIATAKAELFPEEDLATLQKLQEDFADELTVLGNRVDALEVATAELKADQFSTTTKLNGEVIFALSTASRNNKAIPSNVSTSSVSDVDSNLSFSQRAILNLETSFTGQDALIVSVYGNNFPDFLDVTGSKMARLVYEQDTGGSTENDFGLFYLSYQFPIGERLNVLVEPYGGVLSDFVDTINPFLGSAGDGSISAFGNRNPIYWQSSFGAGVGVTYNFSNTASLSLGYLATEASNPNSGLTGGSYGAIAQLTLRPAEAINLGLTYVRSFNGFSNVGVGSIYANDPFDGADNIANSYGFEASFQISPQMAVGGWVGYVQTEAISGANEGANATILNYAITLAFPDLFQEGNLAGIVLGIPPKVTSNEINLREDKDTSLHLEAFYRFQLTKNIGITPGILVITNPEHNKANNTIYIGTLRTTFSF